MMAVGHSVHRLSALRDGIGVTSYLEVGVFDGSAFNAFDIARKDAVDPTFRFDTGGFADESVCFFEVPSDGFLLNFAGQSRYDPIFLDVLHTFEQTFPAIQTGGNHQLVVWTQPRKGFRPCFNSLETISRLDYFTLQRHLDLYSFGPEAEVLAEAVAAVTARTENA